MTNKLTPFDFIKSASKTKINLLDESSNPKETAKEYNPFVVNKGFGMFEDTILHANEMNLYPNIPVEMQYLYYLEVVRPRNRFKKWNKKIDDTMIDVIAKYYQCNRSTAKQYASILSPENMEQINTLMAEGIA